MTTELHLLGRNQFGALAKLHAVCFPADPWTVRDFMELLMIRSASGRLAMFPEGGIAAFMLDLIGPDDAEILTIGVAPGARRQGLARLLIGDLMRRARQRGMRRILLEVAADNEPGITLYTSAGFVLLGKRPHYYRRPDGNTDAFIFGFSLAALPDHQ